ncbi:hypothetical protein Sango_0567600 [Sesamum angolense]|uniref:Disease resistance N-terminal domain-containing protein n=1 Tax=Sesamum angolense TaxID=2727404 RepID=A0AAE1X5P2_9LAMI|nr:hypothetical protein Sango_0567600 [Sesamum angolense]
MLLNRLAPLIEKRVREEPKGVADPRVKSWLDKLQDIAYDIDDVLDEWELENIRQKVLKEEEDANNSHDEASSDGIDSWEKKVCSFLQSVCLCFKQTIHRRSIAKSMKAINGRLDSIAQENENEFNFIPNLRRDTDKDEFKRIGTTSFVDVSEILGAAQVVLAQDARHLTLLHTVGTTDKEPFAIWQIEKLRSCFWDRNRNPYYLCSHLKRARLLSLRASQGIHKLVNLRHLLNSGGFIVDFRFPRGFENLTNLRTLDEFRVYVNGNKLECLKDLNNLGDTLRIVIGKDMDEHEAQKADL